MTTYEEAMELLRRELGAVPIDMPLPIIVNLPAAMSTPRTIDALKQILDQHPGSSPVRVRLHNGQRAVTLALNVTASPTARAALRRYFGRHVMDEL